MYNSKDYFKRAIWGRLEELSLYLFFTILFLIIFLPILIIFDTLYYALIPIVLIVISTLTIKDGTITGTSYNLNKAKEEFKKEQLIETFHESPNYYKYAKCEVSDVDRFISIISKLKINYKELDEIAVLDSMLLKNTYNDYIKEILVFILMNPYLLSGDTEWITDYINEFHKLLKQYPYTMNPYTITKNTNPKYVSTVGPRETRQRLYDVSKELSSALRDLVEDSDHFVITDIDKFTEDVKYTLGPQVYNLR